MVNQTKKKRAHEHDTWALNTALAPVVMAFLSID